VTPDIDLGRAVDSIITAEKSQAKPAGEQEFAMRSSLFSPTMR
jgi:hypothetical protein